MKLHYGGGPKQPTQSITVSPGNAPIGSREWTKIQKRKKREKNLTPLADSPRYRKQVEKERAALALSTQPANPEEPPTT